MGQGDDGGTWVKVRGRGKEDDARVECFGCHRLHRRAALEKHCGVCQCGRVVLAAPKLGRARPAVGPPGTPTARGGRPGGVAAKDQKIEALQAELKALKAKLPGTGPDDADEGSGADNDDLLEEIRQHEAVLKVVKEGTDLYKTSAAKVQELRAQRAASKPAHVQQAALQRKIDAAKKRVTRHCDEITALKEQLENAEQESGTAAKELAGLEEQLRQFHQKALTPNAPAGAEALAELEGLVAKLGDGGARRALELLGQVSQVTPADRAEGDNASDAGDVDWDEIMGGEDAFLTDAFAQAAAQAHECRSTGKDVPADARKALLDGFKLVSSRGAKRAGAGRRVAATIGKTNR